MAIATSAVQDAVNGEAFIASFESASASTRAC